MSPVTRLTLALVLVALVLVPATAATALDHLAPQGFEDAGPWSGIASVADAGGPACLPAGRAPSDTAHSGGYVVASWCPALTIRFSTPQAYVTLWAKTDTGGGITIAGPSAGGRVRGTGAGGEWIALTLPVTEQPTISQVVVDTDNPTSRLFIDDLTFSTTAQPDTAITSAGAPALTNQSNASFEFDSSIGRSSFSCRLDGADAAPCTSGKAYTSLADGAHTFSVAATDGPFGHADATPAQYTWHVDTTPPRTRITDGPTGSTTSRAAEVTFSSGDQDVHGFECSLDDAPFRACTSPQAYADLPLGRRTVRVRATDAAGNVEAAPAGIAWTIAKPPSKESTQESTRRLDATGTPSGESAIEPACSTAANSGEPDRDGNGLLDRCQRLPSASLPITAGVQAKVRVTDGEVWVKMPAGGAAARTAAASDHAGWVPLKGASVVPMRSLIDARNGTLEVDSAATTGRRAAIQKARFAAGIFQLRQAREQRAKRATPARRAAPVELHLQTPPGAANACSGAAKATVVRTLSASATGRYRMWGAVSTAHVDGTARWSVSDRCDGTATSVQRGAVTVHDLRSEGTERLGAGGQKLVAAPLFVSLKGRG